ncbi:fasciclin domain-containing protein [Sphingobacterium psychroaquaticum]|uniref:Fasciclin domain-containing protein n=1 Tax=Sphingobacterium psychroaquaticum TaxID=561061 RepID=A0A1X7LD17_9SPHI|nr:fasciclin domain-containing protein [Sphingobacterium psychroaquaticum]SMG51069.1 Fasciclin domain-containing protein [Sphingobacterium psychroaquaticum]
MKINIVRNLFLTSLLGLLFVSCKKDYFIDSGIHKPNYEGTVLDYVKMRKDVFDSLYTVVKLAGLEPALDQNGVTFFAPGDPSIRKAVYALNKTLYQLGRDTIFTLNQVHPSVWREFLSLYIYNDTYMLKDIPQVDTLNLNIYPGQGFISYEGKNMNLGVNYNDVVSEIRKDEFQVVKYAGYRQLFLSYIRNTGNVGAFGSMINAPVATSDLKTQNGVIHALEYRRHTFGFVTSNFVNAAITKGIIYK